jgi:hypothetical protein
MSDMEFVNQMYTKISDIRKIDNNEETIIDPRFNPRYNPNIEDEKIKYIDYTQNSVGKFDYLFEDEKLNKIYNKPKKDKKVKKDDNKQIKLYLILFCLFYFLNSFFIINLINSYRIQYTTSIIIRGVGIVILYHLSKQLI